MYSAWLNLHNFFFLNKKSLLFNFQRKDDHLPHNIIYFVTMFSLQYIPHWFSKFFIVKAVLLNSIQSFKTIQIYSHSRLQRQTSYSNGPNSLLSSLRAIQQQSTN